MPGRRGKRRESQALKYLVARGSASALDLGNAAVVGEMPSPARREGREALGSLLGQHFIRRGFARYVETKFEWVPPQR